MRKFSNLSALEKVSLGVAAALILCLLPLPYGFYTILRLAVAIVAGCWAYSFYRRRETALAITAGAIALLFQPFIKTALDRLTWNIVDIALAAIIVWLVLAKKR